MISVLEYKGVNICNASLEFYKSLTAVHFRNEKKIPLAISCWI